MKTFVAITRLIKIQKNNQNWNYYFHFRGIYEGHLVTALLLEEVCEQDLRVGEDYLLYLKFIGFKENHLKAKLIKVKKLSMLTHL